MIRPFENSLEFARAEDAIDPVSAFRDEFILPQTESGAPVIYLTGNSLGLQPRACKQAVAEVLDDWGRLGVEAHFKAHHPWMPYHERMTESMARIVGARSTEVVVMNSLTVNLHLLMASFYRPTPDRFGILIEADAFPSDQYAVASQAMWHGFSPENAIHRVSPRDGEAALHTADIAAYLDEHGHEIALILLGGVNYYTGQFFDLSSITALAHELGCIVGIDLAHAAGNVPLHLHDWDVDFAAWCTYKYLNAGPGGPGGAFVHNRHAESPDIPRLAGWWGHNKSNRFTMPDHFEPIAGAQGWQLSNPSILAMAALRASLDVFDRSDSATRHAKSARLTGFMEYLITELCPDVQIITPADPRYRGAQLSLRVPGGKWVFESLTAGGVVSDWREPDVIRVAPVPLYNSFEDIFEFVSRLEVACADSPNEPGTGNDAPEL
jgi:kynureninase